MAIKTGKKEWLVVVEVEKNHGIRIKLVVWGLAMVISLLNLHFTLFEGYLQTSAKKKNRLS